MKTGTKENPYSLQVRLFENKLKNSEGTFYAKVKSPNVMNIEQICKQAELRGNASIKANVMKSAVEEFFKEMAYKLASGIAVNTGYFSASPAIKGVFKSTNETFDPDRHAIRFRFNQGNKLRKEIEKVNVEIVGLSPNEASLDYIFDLTSTTENELATANKIIKLVGNKIRVAGDDESVGVYFTNTETQKKTKVPMNDICDNGIKSLSLLVPDLEAGEYTISVLTQFSSSTTTTKEVTTLELPHLIEVVRG
jgi:hypothetical protein